MATVKPHLGVVSVDRSDPFFSFVVNIRSSVKAELGILAESICAVNLTTMFLCFTH